MKNTTFPIHWKEQAHFPEAIQAAAKIVRRGMCIAFSRGTSYDAFKDFEERGELFRKTCGEL
jgi:UDP-N-acetylmuramoylalanine-D-glutamate ligase